jgi:putative ABC transport system permease protein
MRIISEWFRRLVYLLRRGTLEEELRREMEAHRELMGDPRSFGNTLRLREEARDVWGWRWLDDVVQDTRIAWRTLRQSPGFSLTAIATLALGIGANVGMFSLVNSALLRPLYERPDAVVDVYGRSRKEAGQYRRLSYPNYLDLNEGTSEIFETLAATSTAVPGVDFGDGARRTLAFRVTANYFQIFDQPLARGRAFTAEEERLGADLRVAIISHSLWQQRGADPNIIGQTLRINGETSTVVGVAAEGFSGTAIPGPDVWLPLGVQRTAGTRADHHFAVVGRLRAGLSIETASPAIDTVARRLEQMHPAINGGYTLDLSAPSRLMFMPGPGSGGMTATIALALMIMPGIVLLVACLNLANLLLARGHLRRQELAIRSSLGGGRGRLTRQLLTEGLLLALAGGALGLVLARWAADALLASLRPVLPVALSLPEVVVDWRVLAGTIGFSIIAALVFAAWPAWSVVSTTGRAIVTHLKRRTAEDRRRPGGIRLGNALVIGQLALSLLLLASGGLFLMSALAAVTANPGFELERGLLAEIDPSLAGYDDTEARELHLALVDRLRSVPGVQTVTIGSSFPFSSSSESREVVPAGARSAPVDAIFTIVGRDYARTLGLPMLGGRDFSDAELASSASERVAIVDDALAERLWPKEGALGQLIEFRDSEGADKQPMRVVGIVPAVKHSLGDPRPCPHVYVPLGQHDETAMTLQFRAAPGQDDRAMLAAIARVIRDVDVRVPILRLQTWRDHLDSGLDVWLYRAGARMCAAFGGIALLLAAIGVYGVKSYVVSRRTREFGIRIAVGAHPRALLWQVMREGGRVTAYGLGIGLLLAIGAGQILQSVLYGVNAVEPVVLITAPLILLAASLLASLLPALRATSVDPTVALRAE